MMLKIASNIYEIDTLAIDYYKLKNTGYRGFRTFVVGVKSETFGEQVLKIVISTSNKEIRLIQFFDKKQAKEKFIYSSETATSFINQKWLVKNIKDEGFVFRDV